MPILDFKEFAQANEASGLQDSFELFARDFLAYRGYSVLSGPDRGADAGRDLVVLERRVGVGGETTVKWLVSCKHKAHSGESVRLLDEADIYDRMTMHECTGFIGFYSTLPASGLSRKLDGIKLRFGIEVQLYDRERIESELLQSSDGQKLAERYFPTSFTRRLKEQLETLAALLRGIQKHLISILAWAKEIEHFNASYDKLIDEYADYQHSDPDSFMSFESTEVVCFNETQRAIVFDFAERFKMISNVSCENSVNEMKNIGLSIKMAQERLVRSYSNKSVLSHEIVAHLDKLRVDVELVVEVAMLGLKVENHYQLKFDGIIAKLMMHIQDAIANIEEIKWIALDLVIEDATPLS